MMDKTQKFVAKLNRRGVTLSVVDGGKLTIDKPVGMNVDLAQIREHKVEIIGVLNHRKRQEKLRWIGAAHLVIGLHRWQKVLAEFGVGDDWADVDDETVGKIQESIAAVSQDGVK